MPIISRRKFLKTAIVGGIGITALPCFTKNSSKGGVMNENKNNSPWPNNCKGAISLTFDDGNQSQLDIAIPILEEYNLLGTFYINPRGDDWKQKLQPWREVALNGHEIGNHTINHICSQNFAWGPNVKSLETSTLDEIESDVLEADRRLKELIPEKPVHTFCYPCYQTDVGEGRTRQSYIPVIAKYFPAARGIGEAPNHPLYTDLHYLTSWVMAGWMSGSELCGFPKVAADQGRWGIMAFHGFQNEKSASKWTPGSYYHGSPVSAENFRQLCEYLDTHRDEIWTAPVISIAQEIIAWRENVKK